MKIPKILVLFLISFLCFTSFSITQAQTTDKELLAKLMEEEQDAVNALVMYPKETRVLILEGAQYPEALIKIENIQSQTSGSFKTLLEVYPQKTQQMIWDLTRYPDLIERLAKLDNPSKTRVNNLLKDYPEVIHPRAKEAVNNYHPVLVETNQLQQTAAAAFEAILLSYTPEAKKNLQELLELPEVLSILTENIRLTILVGDLYQKDPDWILHKADSLNLEIARQNAKELDDWKESLENNPQAKEELEASAKNYAEEYSYDEEYYDEAEEDDDLYYEETDQVVVHHYYNYHYPYWFSYPHWYQYPRWRSYPYWSDWGFHYYSGNTIIIIDLPSFHFTHWYFHRPYHHHRWSHLSAHFVRHYHSHRGTSSSITTTVTNWRGRNRAIISEQWMKNDPKLSNRFKEFGKFESSREKYNKENPRKKLSQKDFAKQNQNRYPELSESSKDISAGKDLRKKSKSKDISQPNVRKPRSNFPKTKKPKTSKIPTRQKEKTTKTKKDQTPSKSRIPKVNKAKDYHKNKWEKTNTRKSKVSKAKIKPKTKTKTKTKKSKRKD